MSVLVGFSKVNLMDILPQNKHCENDILGIGFYLEQEEKKSFFCALKKNRYIRPIKSVGKMPLDVNFLDF